MKGLRLTERGWLVLVIVLGALAGLGYSCIVIHQQHQACQDAQQTGTAWRIQHYCERP